MKTTGSAPSSTAVSPRWNAVDCVVDFNTREKRLGLLTETLGWVMAVAFFRRAESETHYLAEPSELDRRYHKSILATLVAEGERLLTQAHRSRTGGLSKVLEGSS